MTKLRIAEAIAMCLTALLLWYFADLAGTAFANLFTLPGATR